MKVLQVTASANASSQTLIHTPQAGDVLYFGFLHSNTRTVTAMSGCGATWTRENGSGASNAYWYRGTGANATGTVTMTLSGSITGGAMLIHLRPEGDEDLNAVALVDLAQTSGAGLTSQVGPTHSAHRGQFVAAMAQGGNPVALSPNSGLYFPVDTGSSAFLDVAWAKPINPLGVSVDHRMDLTCPSTGFTAITQIVIGSTDPGPLPQRFLLTTSATAADASPSYDGLWTHTSNATRRRLQEPTDSTTLSDVVFPESVGGAVDVLGKQYVGWPILPANLCIADFKLVVQAREGGASSDNILNAVAKVVSEDVSTLRGKLYSGQGTRVASTNPADPNYEFGTANASRRLGAATTRFLTSNKDRLILELGYSNQSASSAAENNYLRLGTSTGSVTDLPYSVDNTSTTARAWFEVTPIDPPTEPLTLTGDPTIHEINAAWLPPDGFSAPDGYEVRIDGGAPTDVGNVLTYQFTGLAGETEYTIGVRAKNDAGNSSWVEINVTTDPDIPGAPTNLAIDMTSASGELTWEAPLTGSVPTGYQVRVNGASMEDVGLTLEHLFLGLVAGTTYEFEVRAYSPAGAGPWASIEGTTDDAEAAPPSFAPITAQPAPSPHNWVRYQRRGWRYFATRLNGDGTETFLEPDLPLEDVGIEEVLSGDDSISGKLEPVYSRLIAADGKPLMSEWSTAIYAEQNGAIRAGAILVNSGFDGPSWEIDCVGFTGYARDLPYIGTGYKGIEVDPIDVVRVIWAHIQGKRGGNLGLTLDTTDTNGEVSIGTELRQVEFDTQSGPVSFEAGPYKLNQYTSHNLAADIDKLANETPFDYRMRHWWDGDILRHHLDIGYPQIGRRREDLRFIFGVNIFDPVQIDRDGETYASGTLVLGAGTGPSMVQAVSEPPERPGDRLRRIAVVVDDTIRSKTRATKRANAENQWRARLDDVSSVIVRDHPNARLGSAKPGDEIRLEGQGDWVGIDMWVRVLAISYEPDSGNVAEYHIARTDKLMS